MTPTDLDVLEANASFYRAFSSADADAMEQVWAERHPVACIHPGWDVLDGRRDVIASWRNILESTEAPEVSCSLAEARVLGETAFVTCHEVLPDGRLAATNVFVREDGRWRMVHHQASLIAPGQVRTRSPVGPAN
jgi:ketosteroid isomerase-like protein